MEKIEYKVGDRVIIINSKNYKDVENKVVKITFHDYTSRYMYHVEYEGSNGFLPYFSHQIKLDVSYYRNQKISSLGIYE